MASPTTERMAKPSAIPESLWPEVLRLHKAGQSPYRIAEWLSSTQGITCSHMAVRRTLDKIQGQPPAPRGDLPPQAAPAAPGDDGEAHLRHWKRKAHLEAVAAERLIEEDPKVWQRYHSAMRLIATFDAAIDKKRLFEAEFGDGAGSRALTSDEEAAAVEAARQTFVSIYELQDPSTLPAPGPGAPLDDGGRPMPN